MLKWYVFQSYMVNGPCAVISIPRLNTRCPLQLPLRHLPPSPTILPLAHLSPDMDCTTSTSTPNIDVLAEAIAASPVMREAGLRASRLTRRSSGLEELVAEILDTPCCEEGGVWGSLHREGPEGPAHWTLKLAFPVSAEFGEELVARMNYQRECEEEAYYCQSE